MASDVELDAGRSSHEATNKSERKCLAKLSHSTKSQVDTKKYFRRRKRKKNVFHRSILTRSAEVRLTAEHQLPVLLGEFYPIRIRIENLENVEIKQATWEKFTWTNESRCRVCLSFRSSLTCTCSMSDENNSIGEDSKFSSKPSILFSFEQTRFVRRFS